MAQNVNFPFTPLPASIFFLGPFLSLFTCALLVPCTLFLCLKSVLADVVVVADLAVADSAAVV